MEHYVGIDLHARTLQLCVIDAEKGERILERARVPNRLPEILALLEPFKEGGVSIAVESTFNWYWLVDGLQDAGYEVHLAHTLGNARITNVAHFELERIRLLQTQITKIERQIEDYAGDLPEIVLVRGLPGVDLALAPIIVFETGEISRFASHRTYSSYCRLVPGCANSSNSSKPGRSRKEGNPLLKSAFTQAATHATRTNERVRRYANRQLSRRSGRGRKAIVRNNVGHKLAIVVWMMLTHGVEYDEKLLFGN